MAGIKEVNQGGMMDAYLRDISVSIISFIRAIKDLPAEEKEKLGLWLIDRVRKERLACENQHG